MLSNETLKKLHQYPEFKEVIAYLVGEVNSINTLKDLPESPLSKLHQPVPIGIEVRARLIAHARLSDVVSNLIDYDPDRTPSGGNKEYIV